MDVPSIIRGGFGAAFTPALVHLWALYLVWFLQIAPREGRLRPLCTPLILLISFAIGAGFSPAAGFSVLHDFLGRLVLSLLLILLAISMGKPRSFVFYSLSLMLFAILSSWTRWPLQGPVLQLLQGSWGGDDSRGDIVLYHASTALAWLPLVLSAMLLRRWWSPGWLVRMAQVGVGVWSLLWVGGIWGRILEWMILRWPPNSLG